MDGKRRFSQRIAARQTTMTNTSEKHDGQLNEIDEPVIKRKTLEKNHHKTIHSDCDKVDHDVQRVSDF